MILSKCYTDILTDDSVMFIKRPLYMNTLMKVFNLMHTLIIMMR